MNWHSQRPFLLAASLCLCERGSLLDSLDFPGAHPSGPTQGSFSHVIIPGKIPQLSQAASPAPGRNGDTVLPKLAGRMHVPNATAVRWDTSSRRTVIALQALQFPAKTGLKEVHHAHGSAAGLEAPSGSQHMFLPHPCSLLGTDHFPIGLNGKGMQVRRQEASLVHQKPGQGHNICLVWRLPRFCSEPAPGPSPRGVIAVCVPQTAAWGHRGLPRLRRKLRPGAENKIPFFVGKCSDLKWSDSLISGFESHTLIVCQD